MEDHSNSSMSSVSKATPKPADEEEICLSVGNLALGRDGTLRTLSSTPPRSSANGANSSSILPPKTAKHDFSIYPQLKEEFSADPKFRNTQGQDLYTDPQFRIAQLEKNGMDSKFRMAPQFRNTEREELSNYPQFGSRFQLGESLNPALIAARESPVIPDNNIWAHRYPQGDSLLYDQSLGSRMGYQNYPNNYNLINNLGYGPNNFAVNLPARMSNYRFERWDEGQAKFVQPDCGFVGMCNQMNGLYNSGYYTDNGLADSTHSWDQFVGKGHIGRVKDKLSTREDSMIMEGRSDQCQRSRQCGKNEDTTKLLRKLLDGSNIYDLLTEKTFQNLVQRCDMHELLMILKKTTSERELFIQAAFNAQGSHTIQELIKRLKKVKKMPITSELTEILSTRFCDMMVDSTARHVIAQCMKDLGDQPNELLYELAIEHLPSLSTDQVGCLAVNDIVDAIVGPYRWRLLDLIAEESPNLSNDPIGNHNVQHVIKLCNPEVTRKILHRLQGKFRDLSMKQGGSHVVEKCINYSSDGVILVVQDLLNTRDVHKVAKDRYGNYVIQTALKALKKKRLPLYFSLVKALEPHFVDLEQNSGGRSVISLITGAEKPQKSVRNVKRGQV